MTPTEPGAGKSPAIGIEAQPIDTSRLIAAVAGTSAGAIAVFIGTVRATTRERRVLFLEYEAYVPMAEQTLREIAEELRSRFALCGIAMVHRIGRLEIGETSVVVAAAAAHRRAALDACAEGIERIKKSAPIWKKEHFEGGAVWIERDPSAAEGRSDAAQDRDCSSGLRGEAR